MRGRRRILVEKITPEKEKKKLINSNYNDGQNEKKNLLLILKPNKFIDSIHAYNIQIICMAVQSLWVVMLLHYFAYREKNIIKRGNIIIWIFYIHIYIHILRFSVSATLVLADWHQSACVFAYNPSAHTHKSIKLKNQCVFWVWCICFLFHRHLFFYSTNWITINSHKCSHRPFFRC